MAQITLNIPDDKETRFIQAFALVYGWNTDLNLTKKQFMKDKLKDYMKEVVYQAEVSDLKRNVEESLKAELNTTDLT